MRLLYLWNVQEVKTLGGKEGEDGEGSSISR